MLNDQINAAREVTKTNTSTLDTFKSLELGFIGYMQDNKPHFYRQSTRKNTTDTEFDIMRLDVLPQVEIVYGYANVNRIAVDAFMASGAREIVYAGVGDGSLADPVKSALIEARKQGAVIVRSSRVGQGIVARNGEANDDELAATLNDTPQSFRHCWLLQIR